MRPLIVIHGWNDNSKSFLHLAKKLEQTLNRQAKLINLADYISMDDEVTFADIVTAMTRAWHQHKLPTKPHSVDAIVHSTGGLIIRDWLVTNFTAKTAPLKHLVMLAPANFGSHLAHKGRAFYGRVLKGFKGRKMFHVGEKLLNGLELASHYTWQLAEKDCFGDECFYGSRKILCTVLIGNTGYRGIQAAANETGSDGTVRISCANLNPAKLVADFSENPMQPKYSYEKANGVTAFVVIDNNNHSTITARHDGQKNQEVFGYIVKSLTITDEKFAAWCERLEKNNKFLSQQNSQKHGLQNTIVKVRDQYNQPVKDYFLEFYNSIKHNDTLFEEIFYEQVIRSVHVNRNNPSFRSFYLDCARLHKELDRPWRQLYLSLTAHPELQKNNVVGFKTFTKNEMGAIQIPKTKIPTIFMPNRTLLIEIILRREQANSVFEIKSLY